MQDTMTIQIKTLSNLFIGGVPAPFEIGGIDQRTAVDPDGFPCIPGSSFKGALRSIIHEDHCAMTEEISQLFSNYLKRMHIKNQAYIEAHVQEAEALCRLKERYDAAYERISPEYLFGVEGFNNTPKLLFSDLLCSHASCSRDSCFSIDMKNSIDLSGDNMPQSNPRAYQTARQGLVFEGTIRFYKIEELDAHAKELCKKYITFNLMKFNEGMYRLGNSKSRGYGRVEVIIADET